MKILDSIFRFVQHIVKDQYDDGKDCHIKEGIKHQIEFRSIYNERYAICRQKETVVKQQRHCNNENYVKEYDIDNCKNGSFIVIFDIAFFNSYVHSVYYQIIYSEQVAYE